MASDKFVRKYPPLGWGIIGASTIAQEFMVDAIRQTGGAPRAVMSGDAARAKTFAEACAIPGHTTSLDELLDDKRIGAVYISSANSKHHQQVLAAARAGKHVLCDKPLATNSSDAREMVRVCRDKGVVLAINHHLRASRIHREMRRIIADGGIGDVRSVMIVHAGLLRQNLQTWRIKDAAEGAIYLDLSVHDIDLARFLLQQDPVSAVGIGGALMLGKDDIHDHTMYAMAMNGGAFVQAHESFVTPDVESQVVVLGSKGALHASGTLSQKAQGALERREGGRGQLLSVEPVDLYAETITCFLDAIHKRGEPLASGADALISLIAAEAVAASVLAGRSVKIEAAP